MEQWHIFEILLLERQTSGSLGSVARGLVYQASSRPVRRCLRRVHRSREQHAKLSCGFHTYTHLHTCAGFHTYTHPHIHVHAPTHFQSMFHSPQVLELSHGPHDRDTGVEVSSLGPPPNLSPLLGPPRYSSTRRGSKPFST